MPLLTGLVVQRYCERMSFSRRYSASYYYGVATMGRVGRRMHD